MISYIGSFLILIALLNASLLVLARPIFSKISTDYDSLILSTSKLQFPLVLIAFICLIASFVNDDFSLRYISSNSNSALPFFYKISATWAGHEGSMLLWCLILSFWTFMASIYSKSLNIEFRTKFLSIMGFLNLGFLLFLVFTSNPFEKNISIPIDGKDLNPLLQDFGLIVHPPMLYMGYVGLSVVFSFAVTCLLQNDFKREWARWVRPWALISWSFLTLGIALGSWWAYYELGWGGWWFWDPVENASFMPWLVTTALIHSLITCEQKAMFKNWTILLSIIAFSLSLLGTFLVRSGILISVHSFANDPARGAFILLFLTIIVGGSLLIYFKNAPKIQDNISFDFFSRESFFLINNILLVTATFTILLGTIYPLLLDLLGLEKISVGVPYYNAVFLPIMTPLVLLAGYIPIMFSSKSKNKKYMISHLLLSFLIVILFTLFSIYFLDNYNISILLGIFIFIWISFNIIYDLIMKIYFSNIKKISFSNIGMMFAHLGLAVFILGATIVENNKVEKEVVIKIGDTIQVKDYTFEFKNISEYEGPNYQGIMAKFLVYENNNLLTELYPEKRIYASNNMPMTEAGIDPGLSRDLYITLGTLINDDVWSVRIYHKPLIRLIWLGALMMVFGGILSVLYKRKNLAFSR
ncbi:MAG: heme lyase CcmF/NrfE family subunit [Gammaproteobacteria bacterium]|jgi:cytochrome c-type biogenesis protein CcmF|nr:heme lyase CcmF/NrfE family subunit [Gammaproteobacteria bacterium]MBT4462615.1 heme lyase CcmF/NrfE family subunit [Gammaproteobacteria bacterium]MBT4654862.1 heme lyase CcmF/NrfE family subunit [Gammaproteobacteria bacterium]MBT5116638.1 heme lyase CcmF/NrfE family subunit [Gammaproteobacteria bacterium]MBT6331253.1 heme lyase CcmF/NrfE family subunit [Gammaproteobacteria bacterium]